jgi:indolepyruvate ferredoxin oxidoreductase alpha subunit
MQVLGGIMLELLSGNEAIAQGAWEAGCTIGVAYPGTPSTETMERFAEKDGVYAEWCVNEKVALEVALGASAGGSRSLVTMKHVGVNVAADPLFTASYTGVGAGLVILAADDPGMHSSQNEQDSHFFAQAAQIPMLDPSNSQEAHDFTRDAYGLSEEFDVPFFIRSSVRISHTQCACVTGDRAEVPAKPYSTNPAKWVMMPAFAKPRRIDQLKRNTKLEAWVENCEYNKCEIQSSSTGIVCSGAVYEYVKDAMPDASVFKLGVTWPLPKEALTKFASQVKNVYVIEEASTYLKSAVSALGITVSNTPNELPAAGELSPFAIKQAFGVDIPAAASTPENLPARPPALCPGCPHRLVFKELTRLKAIITGDIGCYTLGALPPLSAMDTCVDMGASVSMAHGFELALAGTDHRPVVAVIGDSTFAHSGITSLATIAYNKGNATICILDNRTTAMTGRQGNPFNGTTLQNRESREIDIETLVRALGIEDVCVCDPNDMKATRQSLKAATTNDDLSVIIFRSPCVLLTREKNTPYVVTSCTSCGVCLTLGCPAIGKNTSNGNAYIDSSMCIGCGQCAQYCNFNAIEIAK